MWNAANITAICSGIAGVASAVFALIKSFRTAAQAKATQIALVTHARLQHDDGTTQ
jgi:L-serine deaminase